MPVCPGQNGTSQAYLHVTRPCLSGHAGPPVSRKTCVLAGRCSPGRIRSFCCPLRLSVCLCQVSAPRSRRVSENIWPQRAPCGERVVAALIPVVGATCLLCREAGRRPAAAPRPPHRSRAVASCWGPRWVIFSTGGGPAAFN